MELALDWFFAFDLVACSSFSVFESYVKTRKRGILQAMSGNQIESEKPIKSELHSLYLLQQSQSITISQMIYMLIVYSIPMSTMSSRWSVDTSH